MNKMRDEVAPFFNELDFERSDRDVIVAVPAPFLAEAVDAVRERGGRISIAAQNCHQATHGAYTGEVSFSMLQSIGVQYVILGHSERRQYYGENDRTLSLKIDQVLSGGGKVIWCCGEQLEDRQQGKAEQVVRRQWEESCGHLSVAQWQNIIIAYEPVWAIGTGEVATPDQAEEMHAYIRNLLPEPVQSSVRILYGGSMKPTNAQSLLSQPNVDGGLIGGASLSPVSFGEIIDTEI